MDNNYKIDKLVGVIDELYLERSKDLLFHGLHHINFVRQKSKMFAESINANVFLVESAALVHDVNYLEKQNSEPETGQEMRKKILSGCEYIEQEIKQIEDIIQESHTATRSESISDEAKALSDADTLFKSLPITPILFTSKYMQETGVDIKYLANKITSEQNKLFEGGIYFYTDIAKEKYLGWAKTNLELWNNINKSLEDPDVAEIITLSKKLNVL